MKKKSMKEMISDLVNARDTLQAEVLSRVEGKTDSQIAELLHCDRGHANWVKRKLTERRWVQVDALVRHAEKLV